MKDNGLYIHIPFCKSKCAYCDFFRITDLSLIKEYTDAVVNELFQLSNEIKKMKTIYIGGGTPSIMNYSELEKILHSINLFFDLNSVEEFTVECNPEDVNENLINLLIDYGVNRISLGVQSLNNNMLKFMNRRHSAEKVFSSVELINKSKIENVSVDIIFGLPKIDDYNFIDDINKFLNLDVKHISAYSLSYEDNSYFSYLLKNGKLKQLPDDDVAFQYEYISSILCENGFCHYEISNYCRCKNNKQYIFKNEYLPTELNNMFYNSKHNTSCWLRVPYYGVGAGAYSFDGYKRWNNISNIKQYISLINRKKTFREYESLSDKDVYNEIVMLGLRTSFGVNIDDIPEKYKTYFIEKSSILIEEKMLCLWTDKYYRIVDSKWFLLDLITEKMML